MAFDFFRKRQKLVLIIMVVLMLAFLLSGVLRRPPRSDPGKVVLGRAGDMKLTIRGLRRANRHLSLLENTLRLGQFLPPRTGEAAFLRFLALNQGGDERATAWALLVHEARQMGLNASESQARDLLNQSELTGEQLQEVVNNLSLSGYTQRDLIRAAQEYLDVTAAFVVASPAAPPTLPSLPQPPPSMQEMRQLCRDLGERVQLAVVSFPVEDFAADAEPPTDQQIAKHFDDHKNVLPSSPGNKTQFGFGYLQEDQADIAWLLVDYDLLLEAVDVPQDRMERYWHENRQNMKKLVELPAPSTGTGTAPATQPAQPQYREVPITDYADAIPEIRRILAPQVAQDKADQLLRRARDLIAAGNQADDPYAEAAKVMIRPADKLLTKSRPGLRAIAATLEETIEQLGKLWELKIIYPLGTHDTLTLAGSVQVKLSERTAAVTLGEVLAEIQGQLKHPQIEWATCEKLPNVIFPAKPVNLAPIHTGRTKMIPRSEIVAHEILGQTRMDPRGGQSLAGILATATVFQGPDPKQAPLIEPGKDFRYAMYVGGERRGKLLWRLADAKGQYEPQTLTDAIRKQVVADIRVADAFGRAQAAAEKAIEDLAGADLEKFAKGRKLTIRKTEPFPRKQIQRWLEDERDIAGGLAWARMLARQQRDETSVANLRRLAQEIRFRLAMIEMLHRANPQAQPLVAPLVVDVPDDRPVTRQDVLQSNLKLIEGAFKLAPEDADSTATDRPTAVVPLPRLRKVLLIQRIGYDIPTEQDFLAGIENGFKPLIDAQRRQQAMREWFAYEKITARTGYIKAEEPEEPKAKPDQGKDRSPGSAGDS